jgi:hypothetical protein
MLAWPNWVQAEQKEVFENVDIHFIVLSSMDLDADIAAKYGISRGPRKGFFNISAVAGTPPHAAIGISVIAEVTNLLGQVEKVSLREIREATARYSVGSFVFSPEETMRFRFQVTFEDGRTHQFSHTQKMYVEE